MRHTSERGLVELEKKKLLEGDKMEGMKVIRLHFVKDIVEFEEVKIKKINSKESRKCVSKVLPKIRMKWCLELINFLFENKER